MIMQYSRKSRYVYLFAVGMTSLVILPACEEEEVAVGEPSTISFVTLQDISNEGDGLVKILINMDKPQNTETVVHFKVNGNATLAAPGTDYPDYELLSESPVVIKKGETSTAIEVRIIEDRNFEQQLENIIFSLDGILSGNAVLSTDYRKLTHVHEIEENDYMLFLEWESEEVSDLNMFIEMPNKSLLSADSESGFEEVTIANVKDQERYYVDIWFNSGNTPVSYQLKSLNAGEKEKKILVNGNFSSEQVSKISERGTESFQNYLMIKEGRALKVLK